MKNFEEAQEEAIAAIQQERIRQELKWGEQNHDPFIWLAIISEELGEASQQALRARFQHDKESESRDECLKNFETEMIQVSAVAQSIVECMKRGKWNWPTKQA